MSEFEKLAEGAETASACLKAMAHTTRLQAVCHIGHGELSVQELEHLLGTTQSNISQHLCKLKDRNILQTRKQGNQVFYKVKSERILKLTELLQEIFCNDSEF